MPRPAFRNALLSAAVGAAACLPAMAATVSLTASVAPLSSGDVVVGEADPASIVRFQVALRLRDFASMTEAVRARHIFSPAELDARHFPARQDHNAVLSWLTSQGLSIDATVPSRMTITASAPAATVTKALGVHFSHIVSEGRDYVSADSVPSIPADLAGTILSINGLQPQHHAHYMHELSAPRAGTTPYLPSDLLNAYTATGLGTGAGTTTAIVIDTLPYTSDLTTFWSRAGVGQTLSNITFVQAVPGTLPPLSGEESLDTQYASAMGADSKVRVYASRTLDDSDMDTTFQRVISDLQSGVSITQVSISVGECELVEEPGQLDTDDQYFATMSALGASVFTSSGDSGSYECGHAENAPSFYSTSPNVTAVGATVLKFKGTTEKSEFAWSRSGGGTSTYFGVPSYQSGLGYNARAVPDVSVDGAPRTGALIIVNNHQVQVGGTSLSSPVVAGLFGLINAQRIAAGKSTLGLVNGAIYPLLETANFRDVKHGQNGGYKAGVGYDLVTGIGAPLLNALLPTLVALP